MAHSGLLKLSTALLTVAAFSPLNSIAQAQDAGDTDVLVVTGSYIGGKTQENSPSPLNVVTRDDLSVQGLNSLADISRNMTFNAGAEINTDAFTQNFSTGTGNINLRNLGLGSTLVLINGKRQTLSASYADDGSTFVDTNSLMPMIMVQRVETLKDGGSAIYGTDAVSGVVNFISRKNFTGLEMDAGYMQTTADNQHDFDISAIWGTEVGDNGHFVIAGSFMSRSSLSASDRAELTAGTGISGSGQPGTLVFRNQIPVPGGGGATFPILPIIDPYCGTAANSIPNPTGDQLPVGPYTLDVGSCGFQFDGYYDLVPEEKRHQLFASFDTDINDTAHLYVEAGYANNKAKRNNAPAFPIASPVPVLVGDGMGGVLPNVPAEVQPLVQSLGLSTILFVGRVLGDNGAPFVSNHDNETFRIASTLDGDINESWTWETSATYSKNTFGLNVQDVKRNEYITALTNGSFNPFGTAWTDYPNSQAVIDAITGDATVAGKTDLFTYDAHVTGEVAQINGNPVQVAIGGQYRRSTMNYDWSSDYNGPTGDNGDGSNGGVFAGTPLAPFDGGTLMFLYGGPDYGGNRDVIAGFAELAVPLDDTVDVQLAARYESYGDGVDSFDPKVSVLWRPNDMFSARASYSTTFRAPSLYNTYGVQTALNEITLGSSSTFLPVTSIGNAQLKPETSDVINIGFTWEPVDMLSFGVDYWRYDFSNLITQENSQSVVNRALNGDMAAYSQLEFSDPMDPTTLYHIYTNIINAPSVKTDGVDLTANLEFPLDANNATLHAGVETTVVFNYDGVDQAGNSFEGAGSRNFTNFARSLPKWRSNFNVGYSTDHHHVNLFMRYIGSYQDDQNNVDVSSYTTFDLQYSYIWGDPDEAPMQFTLGVINLFDKDIPRLNTNAGFDTKVHDPRQRMVYGRVSKRF
ncbi:MAG: TonB-dependent receptor [Emcibacteraceae bacterium]